MSAKKRLPRNGLDKIRDLASRGFSEKDIARALAMSQTTFTKIKQENESVQDALDEGRCVEHQRLYGKLMVKAMGGCVISLLFLLKCRHQYRETLDVTQTNAVQIVFQMPAALDRDSYTKMIAASKETNG